MRVENTFNLPDGRYVYLKDIDDKWWKVTVEFVNGIGEVVDVDILDEKPEIDERRLVYCTQ